MKTVVAFLVLTLATMSFSIQRRGFVLPGPGDSLVAKFVAFGYKGDDKTIVTDMLKNFNEGSLEGEHFNGGHVLYAKDSIFKVFNLYG